MAVYFRTMLDAMFPFPIKLMVNLLFLMVIQAEKVASNGSRFRLFYRSKIIGPVGFKISKIHILFYKYVIIYFIAYFDFASMESRTGNLTKSTQNDQYAQQLAKTFRAFASLTVTS